LTIQFGEYRGKVGEELMRCVGTFLAEKVKNTCGEGVEERLRGVVEGDGWEGWRLAMWVGKMFM